MVEIIKRDCYAATEEQSADSVLNIHVNIKTVHNTWNVRQLIEEKTW